MSQVKVLGTWFCFYNFVPVINFVSQCFFVPLVNYSVSRSKYWQIHHHSNVWWHEPCISFSLSFFSISKNPVTQLHIISLVLLIYIDSFQLGCALYKWWSMYTQYFNKLNVYIERSLCNIWNYLGKHWVRQDYLVLNWIGSTEVKVRPLIL